MKSYIAVLLCATMLLLSGCKAAQPPGIVIGDGSGSFSLQSSEQPAPVQVAYADRFSNAENTVTFNLNINSMIDPYRAKVVTLGFHELTAEDARRVSEVIFGDAVLYEKQPAEQWTRAELSAAIVRWESWKSPTWLNHFHNRTLGEAELRQWQNTIQKHIEKQQTLLPTLPTQSNAEECHWTFYQEAHYLNMPDFPDDSPTMQITAVTERNDIPYEFTVQRNDNPGRKLNRISVTIAPKSSPYHLEKDVLIQQLTATEGVSQAQLEAIEADALQMLNRMGFGRWCIEESRVGNLGDNRPGHSRIVIHAVPSTPGTDYRHRVYSAILSLAKEYDNTYAMPEADLCFAPDGTLLSLNLYSPVEAEILPTEDTSTLSFDELFAIAGSYFKESALSDYIYRYPHEPMLNAELHITELNYSWTPVQDETGKQLFVPTASFIGQYKTYEQSTNRLYEDSALSRPTGVEFLTINIIDGTIVNP